MVDQVADHERIGKRRYVAKVVVVALGNFSKDSSHDLAGPGLRQVRCPLNQVRARKGTNLLANQSHQLLAYLVGRFDACLQRHVGVNALPFHFVRIAHHRGLSDLRVSDQRAFDLGRAEAMA